jgi:hypothetical protein
VNDELRSSHVKRTVEVDNIMVSYCTVERLVRTTDEYEPLFALANTVIKIFSKS